MTLLLGGCIAGVVSLGLLTVQNRRGQRPFERLITGFLLIIAVGFIAGLFVAPPSAAGVAAGLVPRFDGLDSVLLATAMLGATVMPHVVYLHSALTRDRFGSVESGPVRRALIASTRTDVLFAMVLAGSVNIAMLLLAASALQGPGGRRHDRGRARRGQHRAGTGGRRAVRGRPAGVRPGVDVGRLLRGQRDHGGAAQPRVNLVVRRVITLIPALIVLADRRRPDHRSGDLPGGALLRPAVRADPTAPADLRRRADGCRRQRAGGQGGRVADHAAIVALNAVLIIGVFTDF